MNAFDQFLRDARTDVAPAWVRDNVGMIVWGAQRCGYRLDDDEKLEGVTSAIMLTEQGYVEGRAKRSTYFATACSFSREKIYRERRKRARFAPLPEYAPPVVYRDDTSVEGREAADLIRKRASPAQWQAVRIVFGLDGERPHTFEEAAAILGITRQGVAYRVETALAKVREAYA